MKAKSKRKTTKKTAAILTSITDVAEGIKDSHITRTAIKKVRKGGKLFTKLVEATGIPAGYSESAAWFAERMVLASVCLIAISFTFGALFVMYASEPIADSNFYNSVSTKAKLAEDGIKVYSQQVIDLASPIFSKLLKDNREEVDQEPDRLAVRIEKLKQYLLDKKSPFADDEQALQAFAASKNMKLMVAISFVESTYGKHCYYYNCSGIGGTPPNLRKYDSYAEWIQDFDKVLEDRYKDLPPEKFIGLYVQPGSPNWIYGVKQVIREFDELGIEG